MGVDGVQILISDSWGGVAEEAICMFVDDYASVVSHWKWAPQKRPVIAHIKARSKHSFETDTALHTK